MVAVVARTFLKGSSRLRRAVPLINRCTSLLLVLMTTVSVARLIPITELSISDKLFSEGVTWAVFRSGLRLASVHIELELDSHAEPLAC